MRTKKPFKERFHYGYLCGSHGVGHFPRRSWFERLFGYNDEAMYIGYVFGLHDHLLERVIHEEQAM